MNRTMNNQHISVTSEKQPECTKFLQLFCKGGDEAVILYDDVGRIRVVNQTGKALFAYDETQVLYQQMSKLIPSIDALSRNGDRLQHTATAVDSRGTTFPVELTLSAFSDGSSQYYLAIIRPINGKCVKNTVDLSPRQRQVLGLVVDGLTSREIAEQLTISVKTVETHRANIMTKLGVSNVSSLVRYVTENNII